MLEDLHLPEGEDLPANHLEAAKARAANEALERLQDEMEAYSRLCLKHQDVIAKGKGMYA
eukprot:656297-Pyramimonas_sp.AAC.1